MSVNSDMQKANGFNQYFSDKGTSIFSRLSHCYAAQQPAGGNSVSAPVLVSCLMEGGGRRQCPLIGDYGSVDESRGGGGRDKEKEKEEKEGEG